LATDALIDVWVNCPDRETAGRIADAAVGDRLAACANIMAPVASVYHWNGKVERADEVPLLLKSRTDLFGALCTQVRALHPYEVPSIVATAICATDAAYGNWLGAETAQAQAGTDLYRPRRAWFERLVECGPATIKLNGISAGKRLDASLFDRAARRIRDAARELPASAHQGAGFAILHEGEEGRWLLLHWWLGGGILTNRLWRADLVEDAEFVEADPLLMACVWELGVIDFERRAWMRTVMAGATVDDYIADRLPEGTV
jgi:uncharacterized protein involved in tolerance to divalent cations